MTLSLLRNLSRDPFRPMTIKDKIATKLIRLEDWCDVYDEQPNRRFRACRFIVRLVKELTDIGRSEDIPYYLRDTIAAAEFEVDSFPFVRFLHFTCQPWEARIWPPPPNETNNV